MKSVITVKNLEMGIKWGLRENLNGVSHRCHCKEHVSKAVVRLVIARFFPESIHGSVLTFDIYDVLRKCIPLIYELSGATNALTEIESNEFHIDYVVSKVREGICYTSQY